MEPPYRLQTGGMWTAYRKFSPRPTPDKPFLDISHSSLFFRPITHLEDNKLMYTPIVQLGFAGLTLYKLTRDHCPKL
jgi:hypothetical protein